MNLTDDRLAGRELRDAVARGNPESIARAAMANIWPLYSAHFPELTAAIEGLPGAVLERYPVLRVVHRRTAVLARTTRPFKPLVSPEAARSMSPDELDILTLAQMVAFRFSGDVAAALIYARRLQDRILQIRVDSCERIDGPRWYYHYQIGSTLLAAGDSTRALTEFATARQLGRLSGRPDAERLALGRSALALAARGSLDDAELALAELELQPAPTAAHLCSARWTERSARALIDVERLSTGPDSLADLEPYDSIEVTWPFTLLARTRALLADQRPDEALEAIRFASDAHPAQHGSFASDVINAASIDALWAVGDASAARRTAGSIQNPGLLTRLSVIRLALFDARLDTADRGIRVVQGENALDPAQRAELMLLSGWLESTRTDPISADTARQLARVAMRRGTRRLLTTMPRQLFEQIRAGLDPSEASAFDAAITGLPHLDAPRRPRLTAGERRVLNALPRHATTADVAATLHVSPNTVKSQLASLYRKLGCSTRDDAIKLASRLHLIDFETA